MQFLRFFMLGFYKKLRLIKPVKVSTFTCHETKLSETRQKKLKKFGKSLKTARNK